MCGICGILEVGAAGDPDDRRRRVERMSGALVHRGPDDSGAYGDDAVALGFRRLAVIDLETGNQPIRLEDDRAVIVLNGEIYNYRELRRELEPRHRFRTQGDVEVVLALYAEHGIDALRRLNGMFALAIWDRRRRTLFLARDRFGIKPLFVCRENGRLAFASELCGLLAGGFPERRALDPPELRHYLYQKYPTPTGTLLRGVRQLGPATVLEVGPDGERTFRYWDPPAPGGARVEAREAVEELLVRLRGAVRRQLVADVPVGVFLSGGLDSGTLTALTRECDPGALRTFSVGFTGSGAVNELPAAREAARAFDTEHHELSMDPAEVACDLDSILRSLDGPLGDATAIPTWYMSRHARSRVTVALSGEGADELFGGYARQRYDVWLDRVGAWGARALPAALRLAGRPVSARLRRRLAMPPGLARQLDWSRVFTAEQIDELAAGPPGRSVLTAPGPAPGSPPGSSPGVPRRDAPGTSLGTEAEMFARHEHLAARWRLLAAVDPLEARLLADRELFLPGDLLPKVDRMSMAHSLEVRVPYLDDEVVDFVLSLPGSSKVRGRRDKRLLRSAARSVLPAGVATRRKQGFDVPIGGWLRGALREPLTDLLSDATVARRGLFRPATVSGWVREHLEGESDHGERLWLLLALEGWWQGTLDRASECAA